MYTFFTYLDSTEIMIDTDQGSWVSSGAKLPRPMDGLRAANIDGRVLFFGNIIHMYIKLESKSFSRLLSFSAIVKTTSDWKFLTQSLLYLIHHTPDITGTWHNLQVVVIVLIISIMIMITFWSTTRRRTPLFLGARWLSPGPFTLSVLSRPRTTPSGASSDQRQKTDW